MKEGDKRCGRKMLPVASIELDGLHTARGGIGEREALVPVWVPR